MLKVCRVKKDDQESSSAFICQIISKSSKFCLETTSLALTDFYASVFVLISLIQQIRRHHSSLSSATFQDQGLPSSGKAVF